LYNTDPVRAQWIVALGDRGWSMSQPWQTWEPPSCHVVVKEEEGVLWEV